MQRPADAAVSARIEAAESSVPLELLAGVLLRIDELLLLDDKVTAIELLERELERALRK